MTDEETAAPIGTRPLVMLDHDGVLVDSLDVFAPALIEACARAGVPNVTSREQVLALYDGNVFESLRRLGASGAAVREAVDAANRALHDAVPYLRAFPLMPEVVRRLATVRHVVIVTSNAERVVRDFLDLHGVTGADILGAESGHSKVAKIQRLLNEHPDGQPPWFVSDTAGDMREARRAGATPLGVAWGWHDLTRLRAAGAEAVVESPQELLALVAPELAPPPARRHDV